MSAFTKQQQAMLDDLDEKFVHAPFPHTWWMGFGYAGLKKCGARFILSDIWVEKRYRGRGIGDKMLKRMLKAADKAGVELFIYPLPFDAKPTQDSGMTKKQLLEWYLRRGFEKHSKVYYIRRLK